ncbi:uncharacterized protein LOC120369703 isoform X2 [Mauremys reevesii]|uniref:uncharacterized protein LOC120369703 isoform X2 n=1 Tax=Mauremys reevesii TaxID=260615 RepID=UPI00193FACB4|nr:uncharacterized protein LOC120369703 isoform X2 [Mauremys reevesii]
MSGPAWSWPFMMRHWNKQPLRRDPATAAAGSVASPPPVRVQTVLPSMFDAGVGIMQSWFCACWNSFWVMYTCVLLVPVIWVAMVTQHSFSWRSRMALRRKRRHTKKKQKPKAFGCCEEELEEAGASLETCCSVHLEKFSLAQRLLSLRLVERRLQYVARHLDEVLIPARALSRACHGQKQS